MNKAGGAGNQAEGSDWLKPLRQVDATSACSGWGAGAGGPRCHVVSGVAGPSGPPTPHVLILKTCCTCYEISTSHLN